MEIFTLKASSISTQQLLSKCRGPAAHTALHSDLQTLTMASRDGVRSRDISRKLGLCEFAQRGDSGPQAEGETEGDSPL